MTISRRCKNKRSSCFYDEHGLQQTTVRSNGRLRKKISCPMLGTLTIGALYALYISIRSVFCTYTCCFPCHSKNTMYHNVETMSYRNHATLSPYEISNIFNNHGLSQSNLNRITDGQVFISPTLTKKQFNEPNRKHQQAKPLRSIGNDQNKGKQKQYSDNSEIRSSSSLLSSNIFMRKMKGCTSSGNHKANIEKVSETSSAETSNRESKKSSNSNQPASLSLDFIIAGFPKSGTTTLLYAFGKHPETAIAKSERCSFVSPDISDHTAKRRLDQALMELSTSITPSSVVNQDYHREQSRLHSSSRKPRTHKRGLKCPNAIESYKTLIRLEKHSPQTKFVIGLRHPIEMFQSYYNYRVTESYEKLKRKSKKSQNKSSQPHQDEDDKERQNQNNTMAIPNIVNLIGSDNSWRGVSTDMIRYELYLMQFGKTSLTKNMLQKLLDRRNMAIRPTRFRIFLYTMDQIGQTGGTESSESFRKGGTASDAKVKNNQSLFRSELQHFLNLKEPIPHLSHENINHFTGVKSYDETIDICNSEYNELRHLILEQAKETADWIINEFILSPDVFVADEEYFKESVKAWKIDPCFHQAR